MEDLENESSESRSGGLAIVLFVFFTLGFGLTIGGQAILTRWSKPPFMESERFDATPVVDLIQPAPSYSPEEVVTIQIEGLEKPNISAGIQQCFAFASLDNKKFTGPLARFASMVRKPPYDVLMRHHLVLVGQPLVENKTASVMVTLLDNHDQIRVFQFVLSKQEGEAFKDCWMTDAVYPLQQTPARFSGDSPLDDDSRRSDCLECKSKNTPGRGIHG